MIFILDVLWTLVEGIWYLFSRDIIHGVALILFSLFCIFTGIELVKEKKQKVRIQEMNNKERKTYYTKVAIKLGVPLTSSILVEAYYFYDLCKRKEMISVMSIISVIVFVVILIISQVFLLKKRK